MKEENSLEKINDLCSDAAELPQGWQWSTVGECFSQIINGTTTQQNKEGKGIPVSRIETIQNAKFDLTRIQYVADPSSELIQKFRYQPGDIAFSHINSLEHVGKTALYKGQPEIFLHGMNLLRLRISRSDLTPEFAYYFMQSTFFRDEVRRRVGKAVNQVSVNQKNLSSVPFLIAPITKQQHIVARVEALLSQVNAARKQLNRVPLVMKRFRQGVLAAACSGKLTEGWRDDHTEKTSGLLEIIHKERRLCGSGKRRERIDETEWMKKEDREIPDEWMMVKINDILHYQRSAGYGVLQPGSDVPNGIPMVRVCDINDGKLLLNHLKQISPEIEAQYQRTRLEGGEVLVTLVGTIGRCAVVPKEAKGSNVARAVAVLPLCPHVNPVFVSFSLSEPTKNLELVDLAREVARKTLNLGLLKSVEIPLPPLAEQHEIVRRVDALFARADAVEREVAAATKRAEALTQAVLGKAFAGKL